MKMIDPHVHLRDWNQAHKETLLHAFGVAWKCGISALFEMPNTDPPLTTRTTVLRRLADADRALAKLRSKQFHGLYVGLTADPEQIRAAVELHQEFFPRVVGFKLYAGHSTGRMGVTTVAGQYQVWRSISSAGYHGVVALHAEREDLLRPDLRVLSDPRTHSTSRPPLAEIASVQTQLALAEAAGFRGTVHVCHVSTPEALEIITRERAGLPFTCTAAVTPHHLLLDTVRAESARVGTRSDPRVDRSAPGTGFTVNPPLRDPATRARLWEMVLAGDADWIESDHAPHRWEEKVAGAAGLPGIPAFTHLAGTIRSHLGEDACRAMTGARVLDAFGIDPELIPEHPGEEEELSVPGAAAAAGAAGATGPVADPAGEYPWDPYGDLWS
jgi:dihydroorotase